LDGDVKNPFFKAHVAALFEKTALGQDPHAVLAKMPHEDSGDLRRGLALLEGAHGVAGATKDVAHAGYKGLSRFLSPPSAEGGMLSKGLGHAGDFFAKHPAVARTAIGAAALAPILGNALDASQKNHEAELMNAYADPSRAITASLDEFLEKKAELYVLTKHAVAAKSFSAGNSMMEGLSKGLGSAVGGSVAALLFQAIGSGISSLHGAVSGDPKRKAMVDQILRSDPVLSDAIQRHPESKRMVEESYSTMVRFAPTLSMDINAVRSFLREAVLGGSGVNYATIKNLVDTERSISDAKPQYGRK
jgi:hypothetical protein